MFEEAFPEYMHEYIVHSVFIPEISHVEVRNVVLTLRNSSPGWDELSAGIYKSYIDLYIKPLTFLINTSINPVITLIYQITVQSLF